MKFVFNDGGRAVAGYKGKAGDCCVRAFAIATGRSYQEVYDLVNKLSGKERQGSRKRGMSNARTGVHKATAHKVAYELNRFVRWVPCMAIGSGAKVHTREDELPKGRIVVSLSKHYAAVIDGVLHDTYEDNRGGTRCVYGYWDFTNLRR
jgi:hypothetical protein